MDLQKPRTKASKNQKEIIVDFFELHPELNKGAFSNTFTRKHKQMLWEELTAKLNSVGTCVKSMDKWIKCWSDIKQEVKKRYSQREQLRNKTGGGEPPKDLSELDHRILDLIGTDGYAGLIVKEVGPPNIIPDANVGFSANVSMIFSDVENPADEESSFLENVTNIENCEPAQTSSSQINATPQQTIKEIRRGLKRKRQRGMVVPPEKTENLIKAQERTCEAMNNIALNLSMANEIARHANQIAEERNRISERKAVAFENLCNVLEKFTASNK